MVQDTMLLPASSPWRGWHGNGDVFGAQQQSLDPPRQASVAESRAQQDKLDVIGSTERQAGLRVLVLTTSFPLGPGAVSGIFVERLMRSLPGSIAASVVTPSPAWPVPPGSNLPIKCFRYAPRAWQRLAHGPGGIPAALGRNKLLYLLLPTFLGGMFVAALREARHAGVLHANWAVSGVVGGMAAKLTGRPMVTTLRGADVEKASRSRLHRAALRECLRLSYAVVTVSEAMRQTLVEEFPVYRHKLYFIPNGVDSALLESPHRGASQARQGNLRVLTVGSLIARKGIDTIIEATALLRDRVHVEFSVVGDGPEYDRLTALVARRGLESSVRFLGAVAPDHVVEHLAQTDVFVLASHSEGRPNVLLEAFAAGVPVVASDIDGVRELVGSDERGFLFQAGDPKSLVDTLAQLRESFAEAARRAEAARAYIVERGLLWQQTGEQYAHLYREAMATAVRG